MTSSSHSLPLLCTVEVNSFTVRYGRTVTLRSRPHPHSFYTHPRPPHVPKNSSLTHTHTPGRKVQSVPCEGAQRPGWQRLTWCWYFHGRSAMREKSLLCRGGSFNHTAWPSSYPRGPWLDSQQHTTATDSTAKAWHSAFKHATNTHAIQMMLTC